MNEAEKLITAVRALAEALGAFRAELINKGFDKGEAYSICYAWAHNMFTAQKGVE